MHHIINYNSQFYHKRHHLVFLEEKKKQEDGTYDKIASYN